jgi:hypothetical protein
VVLRVNADPPRLASITLSPDTLTIAPGGTATFTALLKDQYGGAFAAAPAWQVSGGGTVSPSQAGAAATQGATFTSTGIQGTFRVRVTSGIVSDSCFVIVIANARTIDVTEPAAGAVYRVGDSLTIRWTASASVSGITIGISPNQGVDWVSVLQGQSIARNDPRWGAYRWKIPASARSTDSVALGLVSDSVLVRVVDYTATTVVGLTKGYFAVRGAQGTIPWRERSLRGNVEIREKGGRVLVYWQNPGPVEVIVYEPSGRYMDRILARGSGQSSLNLGHHSGIRLVSVQTTDGRVTKKITVGGR